MRDVEIGKLHPGYMKRNVCAYRAAVNVVADWSDWGILVSRS